jgi:NADH-quinone oxidoreductase subunit G
MALLERARKARGQGVTVIGSPFHSNEDNGMLARVAAALGSATLTYRSERAAEEIVLPGFDKLARRRDLAANVRGMEVLGYKRAEAPLRAGSGIVIAVGDDLSDEAAEFARGAAVFIAITAQASATVRNADFVLPATTFAEMEGTFTNFEGRVQRFWPAVQPPPLARPAWQILGVLLAGLDEGATAPATAGDAFLRLGDSYAEYSGLSYDIIGARGALMNEPVKLAAGRGA